MNLIIMILFFWISALKAIQPKECGDLSKISVGFGVTFFGQCLTHPFDVLKTRKQVHLPIWEIAQKNPFIFYKGFFISTTRHLFRGSWRYYGLIDFPDYIDHKLENFYFSKEIISIISGFIWGGTETFFITPFERLKVWKITHNTFSLHDFYHQNKTNFFPQLWKGFIPSFLKYGMIKMNKIYFCHKNAENIESKKNDSIFDNLEYSLYQTMITIALSSPFDTLKTHMQKNNDKKNYLFKTVKEIYRNHGIKAFWAGAHYRFFQMLILNHIEKEGFLRIKIFQPKHV